MSRLTSSPQFKDHHHHLQPNKEAHDDSYQQHFEIHDLRNSTQPPSPPAFVMPAPSWSQQRALPQPPKSQSPISHHNHHQHTSTALSTNRLHVVTMPRRHSDNSPYQETRRDYNPPRERSGSHNPTACPISIVTMDFMSTGGERSSPRTTPPVSTSSCSPRRYSRHLKPVEVSWAKHSHSLEMVAQCSRSQTSERKVRSFDFEVKDHQRRVNLPQSGAAQRPSNLLFSTSPMMANVAGKRALTSRSGTLIKCSSQPGAASSAAGYHHNIVVKQHSAAECGRYHSVTAAAAGDSLPTARGDYYRKGGDNSPGKVRYNDTGSLEEIHDRQQMLDEILVDDVSDEERKMPRANILPPSVSSLHRKSTGGGRSESNQHGGHHAKFISSKSTSDIWDHRNMMSNIQKSGPPYESYSHIKQHSLQHNSRQNPQLQSRQSSSDSSSNNLPPPTLIYPSVSFKGKSGGARGHQIEIRIEEHHSGCTSSPSNGATSHHSNRGEQHKLFPKAAQEMKRQNFRNLQQRRSQRINMSGETSIDSFDTTMDSEPDVSDVSRGQTTTSFESTDSTGDSNTSRRQLVQHDSGYKSLENQDSLVTTSVGRKSFDSHDNPDYLIAVPVTGAEGGSGPPRFQLPLVDESLLDVRLRPPSPIPKSPDSDASTRRQQFIRDRKTIQINDVSMEKDDTDERKQQSEKTEVFDRFFKYQKSCKESPNSPTPPLVQIRDYSIDEKSNAVFNDFLREDPQLDRRAIEAQVRRTIRLQRRCESDGTAVPSNCRCRSSSRGETARSGGSHHQQYRSASYCTSTSLQRGDRIEDEFSSYGASQQTHHQHLQLHHQHSYNHPHHQHEGSRKSSMFVGLSHSYSREGSVNVGSLVGTGSPVVRGGMSSFDQRPPTPTVATPPDESS